MRHLIGFGTGTLACMAAALAAERAGAEPSSDRPYWHLSLEELMQVEVRAPTKTGQPVREAPVVGTLVTRDRFEAYGWRTLADVLLAQPGFAPSQDYERITLSSRGQYESWNNNHLRLLVDGVPTNLVTNGTAYVWEMIPLSMVESIEIIRGPGSALYGSNATHGVISINTRKPSGMNPAEAVVGGGNAGTRSFSGTVGGTAAPFGVLAGFRHHGAQGNVYDTYDGSGRADGAGGLLRFRTRDGRATDAAFLKIQGNGAAEGLSLQAHYARWAFATGHGWLHAVPDERERLRTSQWLAWLSWRTPDGKPDRLRTEYVVQWQNHSKDYRVKFLPDGSSFGGIAYPDGVVEEVEANPDDFFARAQGEYRLARDMRVLAGAEATVLYWGEDARHSSNVDLDRDGTFAPFPDGGFHPLKPLGEGVEDEPIGNLGLYLQFLSGRALGNMVSATAGLRYDLQAFDYVDFGDPSAPRRHRDLDQLSPRLGLVLTPHPDLSFKAMAERAFRAPAPSELFVKNSLLGNSDAGQLQPEELTNFTLAADWGPGRHVNFRIDGFWQSFANQIAFSADKNFSANLYSRTTVGLEAEILFDIPIRDGAAIDGFLNHTYAHQLEEEIHGTRIAKADYLTWAPEAVWNAGCAFTGRALSASLQGHFQGAVYRRTSDFGASTSGYRPDKVAPWFTLDAGAGWRPRPGLQLRIQGRNILDKAGYLAKPNAYPFDYRIEGFRFMASMEANLPGRHRGG